MTKVVVFLLFFSITTQNSKFSQATNWFFLKKSLFRQLSIRQNWISVSKSCFLCSINLFLHPFVENITVRLRFWLLFSAIFTLWKENFSRQLHLFMLTCQLHDFVKFYSGKLFARKILFHWKKTDFSQIRTSWKTCYRLHIKWQNSINTFLTLNFRKLRFEYFHVGKIKNPQECILNITVKCNLSQRKPLVDDL